MIPVFSRRRSYLPYLLEVALSWGARLFYQVRTSGLEKIPTTGGALLITNHLSYVDVLIIQLACPRPLRFIGEQAMQDHWFFDVVFQMAGVIPLAPKTPAEAVRRAVEALKAGEVVCIFPEGHISRTGQLMEIKRGFALMARRAHVPVIPAAMDGLWGSVFSFAGNKYLWKSPRLLPTPVFVAFGELIPPDKASVATARQALLDLGAAAFEERPTLKRHLGREVVRALARRPWRVEIIDRTTARREVTSAQLLAASAVLSRRLRATIPEKRIGIVLPPGAGGFIANLAVVSAGKVPVNLNFTAGRAALEASLRLGEITTVLTANAVRAKLPNFPWPERTLDLPEELAAAGGKRALLPWIVAVWILPNQWFASLVGLPKTGDREEAGVLFTSGSSGDPKGVVLTHRNILANCAQISSLSILPRTATFLGCLPLFHSFGFTVTLWYPLLRGCRVVTVPSPLDTRKIIDAINDERADTFIGAPTFIRPLLKKTLPGDLRSLNLVVTGAEKLPEDLFRSFQERFHLEILQGYGLTETSPAANINQYHPLIVTSTGEHQIGKKPGSVGRLLPGMAARIVHPETGEELPHTATGVLWLRGANVFPGYLADAAKTRAAMHEGWFVTGDLARFDDDGFLFIEGRLSRFSKIGGEMVPHGTVEQKIAELFSLDQSEATLVVVMGVPDPSRGESLVLLTTQPLTAAAIREKLLAAGLSALWIPRAVRLLEKIPVLGTGKLDLSECKRLAIEAASSFAAVLPSPRSTHGTS